MRTKSKVCKACGEAKDLDFFKKNRTPRPGCSDFCTPCSRNRHAPKRAAQRDYFAQWYQKNKTRRRARDREQARSLRKQVLDHYGRRCACCGETFEEFLTIDHIDGGGAEQKRNLNHNSLYLWLRKQGMPEGFRTLCYSCNIARGAYGYCPHERERDAQNKDMQ